jgi:tRNA nucleotidyltransferase (CCA-adding enzyme)
VVDDLRRRDFTINAMAAALRPERFGELLDPFGGRSDLERRRIRVLHNLSFTEDPTRIFRAVRFETRFHFRMDPHTEALARHGIEDGILGRITPERLRKELLQTLREPRSLGGVKRMEELGVLEWLAPGLQPDEALLQSLPGAVEWWKKETGQRIDGAYAHLTALLSPLGVDGAADVAERRLHLVPQAVEALRDALSTLADREKLLAPGRPSEIVARLRSRGPQALALLRAASRERETQDLLERYVREWRDTKLEITGEDLKALGFPADRRLGQALARTLVARLDGELHGKQAELDYAVASLRSSEPELAPVSTRIAP